MLQYLDLINGLFELAGAFFIGLNVRAILRDKCVHGISPAFIAFKAVAAVVAFVFFIAYSATLSAIGAFMLCVGNTVWFILYLKTLEQDTSDEHEELGI